jgi:mannose-1-phosphate guanylyltransferase/phosphomannomutase
VINQGVKIYPFKTVEPGATINSSIVWESQGARNLFGRLGVSGLANVDISPELTVRLAMAYATTLKKGATVTTSRDSSRAARALKRAAQVGLTAAGVNVEDLEVATVPVTRFEVRSEASQGGVTVRLAQGDPQSVLIRFLDADGVDISDSAQSKIERLYYREDFRRAMAGDIGDIGFPARALEHYTEALMATVDADAVRSVGYRVVLDYAYGSASFVMPNVLAKLGADVLSVNPYASTAGATRFDRSDHAARVAELVRSSGANLGAVIDPDGEHITFVDDGGNVVSDDDALFCMVSLVARTHDNPRVAMPVSVARAVEELARQEGAEVVWTKLSTPHLMEVASTAGVALAASQEGGFIFPSFLPAYDATAALVNVLAMLAQTKQGLAEVAERAPQAHVAHRSVPTRWEQKGMLMRTLVDHLKDRDVVLVDGVKVLHDDGWALMLPDPEDQVTHVWAEGTDDDGAKNLADEYVRRIEQILG